MCVCVWFFVWGSSNFRPCSDFCPCNRYSKLSLRSHSSARSCYTRQSSQYSHQRPTLYSRFYSRWNGSLHVSTSFLFPFLSLSLSLMCGELESRTTISLLLLFKGRVSLLFVRMVNVIFLCSKDIPVLPRTIFGILDAPMPIFVGMHSSHVQQQLLSREVLASCYRTLAGTTVSQNSNGSICHIHQAHTPTYAH